jgi:hypothetical protein
MLAGVVSLVASFAGAQENRFEFGGSLGYTFSEGVNIDPGTVAGAFFSEVNPKIGLSYGASFGFFVTEDIEIEFSWSQQDSILEAEGEMTKEFADLKVNNYHVSFVYNWGGEESTARPFLFGGLGATHYAPSDVMGSPIEGSTKLSSTCISRVACCARSATPHGMSTPQSSPARVSIPARDAFRQRKPQ